MTNIEEHRAGSGSSSNSIGSSGEKGSYNNGDVLGQTVSYDGGEKGEATLTNVVSGVPSVAVHGHQLNVDDGALKLQALMDEPDFRRDVNRARRKMDWRVTPALMLLWLANFIDRSNVGNAKIAGADKDLGIVGLQWNTMLAVFYITYIAVELFSNNILKRVGGNNHLSAITLGWGMVTCLTAVAQNYAGMIAIRLAMGLLEGGLLPGITLYLSMLYNRHAIQRRISFFYAGASLAGSFGGLLASGLTTAKVGIAGWRFLFLIEGVITIVFAIIARILLPRTIETAKFLNSDDKYNLTQVMAADGATANRTISQLIKASGGAHGLDVPKLLQIEREEFIGKDERFEWRELRRGVFAVNTILTGLTYMLLCVSLYSLSLFLPQISTFFPSDCIAALGGLFPDPI